MRHKHLNRRDFLTLAGTVAASAPLGMSFRLPLGDSWTSSKNSPSLISTFSLVAYDAPTKSWGVAVTSRFLGVGIVAFAKADAGAIANQSIPDLTAGPAGLAMLAEGKSAQEVLDAIIEIDSTDGAVLSQVRGIVRRETEVELESLRDIRQTGVVDAQGNAAAHTGSACIPWAGHIVGDGFCCQGNILAGEQVLDAVAETYTTTRGSFADRLLKALKAGDDAGGDRRYSAPVNSAALLVAKMITTPFGRHDRFIDLRVDDDDTPIDRLTELRAMHRRLMGS